MLVWTWSIWVVGEDHRLCNITLNLARPEIFDEACLPVDILKTDTHNQKLSEATTTDTPLVSLSHSVLHVYYHSSVQYTRRNNLLARRSMLVRAARRKLQRNASRHIQPAYEQLRLPWLCPAQLRYDSQIRQKSTASPPSISTAERAIAKNPGHIRRPLTKRHLASAAGGEHRTALDDYVPFDHDRLLPRSPATAQPAWLQERSRSDLRDRDPSNPLIINNSLATAPRKFRTHKGMSGDLEELHLTLDACLRVGNLERGAALLQRLMKIYTPDSPELLEAHNEYLRANVEHIIRHKDQDLLKALQKWFEIEIRLRGIEPDAQTFALLLKASLQISQRPKMERTVRRYMEFALQAQLREEALSLPILTEGELGLISQVTDPANRVPHHC